MQGSTERAPESFPTAGLVAPMVTVGFATAVGMWLVGFCTHLPGLSMPPIGVGMLLIVAQLSGGVAAGRLVDRGLGILTGLGAGLITSVINLLIVGSVVASADATNGLRPGWAVVVAGSLAFGALCGALGAFLSPLVLPHTREPRSPTPTPTWLARLGGVTAAAAVPVLLSGGLVTSTNAGLAVPDWPTSFTANMFLYPLSKMTGGIYFEHAHRLFGSLVGFTMLTLLVFVLVMEPRRWVKGVAFGAFAAVCAQGVLGGIRVTSAALEGAPASQARADTGSSLALAMVHGVTAQLFFAFLCVLAAFLSPRWRAAESNARASGAGAATSADSKLRLFAGVLLGAALLQLALGSATRHLHSSHAMFTHIGFAVIVVTAAALAGFRASGRHRDEPVLPTLGKAAMHTAALQVALGLTTFFLVLPYQPGKIDPPAAVVVATAHQAIGALLLALSALLLAWTLRLVRSSRGGA